MWGKLERGVLRAVADLLPEKLRDVVDVLLAPVPLLVAAGSTSSRPLRHAGLPGNHP
jgi:hypothetical protein